MNKLIVTLSAIFLFSQCQMNNQLRPAAQTRILMDTVVQIVVYHPQKTEEQLQTIIDRAFQRMEQIDSLTNNYSDSSRISFVNQNAAIKSVPVDTSLMKILRVSEEVSRQTAGNFDMTIGAIKKLWKFETEHPHVPEANSIRKNLELVNYKLVELTAEKVKFQKSNVNLDLGGIAKGYAIDEAIRIIKEAGVTDAMVNAGGDLRVISSDLTRGKRRIWLRHPRHEGKFVGWFPLDEGSVATSGDYERYFFQDSVRYHHILDPKTGYPARKCVSVTVQTKNATIADALATAIFVMGPQKGMIFVNQMPDAQALIIYQKNNKLNIVGSKNLLEKFNFAKDWKN
ncbi:MAG: FAD:protein FMN transferase [Calditrichaeota bacterium]|nr:FAD:protein FMN transferase [Calditrichota bacterium]